MKNKAPSFVKEEEIAVDDIKHIVITTVDGKTHSGEYCDLVYAYYDAEGMDRIVLKKVMTFKEIKE